MKCSQIREVLLTDFLDGRLTPEGEGEVNEHLLGCVVCRELLMSAQEIENDIKTAPMIEQVPVRVWLDISRKIEQPLFSWKDLWGWGGSRKFVYGSVMAGLMVMVMVAGPILSQRRAATARADAEVLMQLVYAEEESLSVEWGQSGLTLVEGYLL